MTSVSGSTATQRLIGPRELSEIASVSRGWIFKQRNDNEVLVAQFGGNEIRFAVRNSQKATLFLETEPYVFMHVYVGGKHYAAVPPEQNLALEIPVTGLTEIGILRTAVSSGPFYVDAVLKSILLDSGGELLPPKLPVPETVFCTFGDSISGNCCIGGSGPFDPHGLGYGYAICERFAWQYYNTARDGSAICCTPFDNPLASARVQDEVVSAKPDCLLVFYGTNDIRAKIDLAQFESGYRDVIRELRLGLPEYRMFVSGLLWNDANSEHEIAAYNNVIHKVASEFDLPCVQPYHYVPKAEIDDGVHPNAAGQQRLARVFGDFIAAQWPEFTK